VIKSEMQRGKQFERRRTKKDPGEGKDVKSEKMPNTPHERKMQKRNKKIQTTTISRFE
jgi:hypothetical protein